MVIGLIVVLAAAAAGLGWQVHRNDVVEKARTDAMDAAAQQAVAMLAYDFENVDQQLADAAGGLAGSFREDYTKLVADSIAPAAKERSLTVQVTVQAKSVVDASSDEATVLLYLNQVTTSSDVPDAKTTGSRVTMDLEKTDGRWLVSRLTPV
ncbi:h domain protein [Rhodococcus sp. HNM0569]|uniref:h domain protein n=1 Tax=Rhodococcus sp. HNM0569 TaxID=2716340 RepID=UPI003211E1C3